MIYLPSWVILLLAPIIGSWIGVLARRLPEGRPVTMARSQCDGCAQPLGPVDLVPLLSYAWLGGRCRHCGARIGWFHPVIELSALTVAIVVIVADDGSATTWIDAALGWALLLAAWIDAETMRLPDAITLPLVLAGLGITWWCSGAGRSGVLYDHAAAAAAGYASFRLLNACYRAIRHHDGLGAGDAKLLAAAGAWLGILPLPYVIATAGVIGIGVALTRAAAAREQLNHPVPFGPALALAFFIWRLLLPQMHPYICH